ncbi:MFS transporter [Nocardioides bruguierae]|uniref:MFS transporter n=1 Tax=Nocardioides bruguierae TaxID=2945102 RepID=A0A9X2DBP0_9ACTN|nr:MFS transporter [Nocardioides bruguierae]MCM0622412.1 MFS transporter [Nocardioides bruguierae]
MSQTPPHQTTTTRTTSRNDDALASLPEIDTVPATLTTRHAQPRRVDTVALDASDPLEDLIRRDRERTADRAAARQVRRAERRATRAGSTASATGEPGVARLIPGRGRPAGVRLDENRPSRKDSTTNTTQTAEPDEKSGLGLGMAIVLVAQLMIVLDATVVNVALPHIDTALGFGPASLSWVLNAYTLAFGGLLLLGGRLGDVLGRLRLFQVGLTLFTLASLLGGLAQTPGQLVAARAAQGVGAALAAPSVLALLTTSAKDDAARHRAFALFAAVSSGGASLGLLLGGVVTDLGSWRWTLWINVPIGLAVVALVGRHVAETPRRPGRFDVLGALLATGGAVSLVYGLVGAAEHGWTSTSTLDLLLIGLAMLAVLVRQELRQEALGRTPLVQPALLRDPRRVGALVVMPLVFGAQMSMFFLVVQILETDLGFGPLTSGLAFLPVSLSIFTMSRFAPSLVARLGAPVMVLAGTIGLALGFTVLSTYDAGAGYAPALLLPLVLIGASAGAIFMPVTSLVMAGVQPQDAGAASGMLQTAQQLGGAVGLAAVVSVYAVGAVPGEVVPGAQAAFLTSAAFASAAALAALALTVQAARRARAARAAQPDGEPTEPLEQAAA